MGRTAQLKWHMDSSQLYLNASKRKFRILIMVTMTEDGLNSSHCSSYAVFENWDTMNGRRYQFGSERGKFWRNRACDKFGVTTDHFSMDIGPTSRSRVMLKKYTKNGRMGNLLTKVCLTTIANSIKLMLTNLGH